MKKIYLCALIGLSSSTILMQKIYAQVPPPIFFTTIHHHIHTPEPYSLEWLYQVARNHNFTEIDSVKGNLDYFIRMVERKLNSLEYELKDRDQTFKREAGKSLGFIGGSTIPWATFIAILHKTYNPNVEFDGDTFLIGLGVTFTASFLLWLHGTISLKEAYEKHKNLPNRVDYHQWLLAVLKNKKAELLKTPTLAEGIS